MKKRVIKDYKLLSEEIREEIREKYPYGFTNHMITFFDKDKHLISALPYETEEVSYLIKMPVSMYLEDEDNETGDPFESLSAETSPKNFDEEQYLMQEEEEESD